jgi:plastocyanin
MRRVGAAIVCAAAALAAGGCSLGSQHNDVVNGKAQFVSKCGTCHTLARAGTKGTAGPNLDQAFVRARETFQGMIENQITHPARDPQVDPGTGKVLIKMPANLVTGSSVSDVAAYVSEVAGAGGQDTGRLAQVGAKAAGTAKEVNGVLAIPVNKAGGLAYQYKDAVANAGQVSIESLNKQPIGHDIAIEGNGVNAKGPVVSNGGTSKFSVNLKPGTYTFFCSVPGHRQGGMVGKLTVK